MNCCRPVRSGALVRAIAHILQHGVQSDRCAFLAWLSFCTSGAQRRVYERPCTLRSAPAKPVLLRSITSRQLRQNTE